MNQAQGQTKYRDILDNFSEKFPILQQTYLLFGEAAKISKDQENTLRKTTELLILEILELIVTASREGREAKRRTLIYALSRLDTLKVYSDMAKDLSLISQDKYNEQLANYSHLGRMIGGWLKATRPKNENAEANK